jgi:rRNA-processing protein FCF1
MEVMLDSSFILSCVRKKINFLDRLEELGFKVIIPREVLQEMKDLRQKVTRDDRVALDISLKLIESRDIKKVGIGAGKVDEKLILLGKKGMYIGTLDNYIKRSVPNKVCIESSKNDLIIERD